MIAYVVKNMAFNKKVNQVLSTYFLATVKVTLNQIL